MDLDLKQEWEKLEPEKKVLIGLGIIVFVIIIYAFNPFHGNSNAPVVQGQPTDTSTVTPTSPVVTPSNSTVSNNTTSTNTTNETFQISADVAKNIATGANPGYTAGQPTQGTVTINNTVVSVWVVPLTQGVISKSIYVDPKTGMIVGSA